MESLKKQELRSEYESTYLAYTKKNYLEFEDWLVVYKGYKPKQKTKQELIDRVIENIKYDISIGDVTVLDELLSFIPTKNLVQALDETEWVIYDKLN
jgi:hypothetical protein